MTESSDHFVWSALGCHAT